MKRYRFIFLLLFLNPSLNYANALTDQVHGGDQAAVLNLLLAGADPNAVDASGQPALAIAAHDGQIEIVVLLLLYRANPLIQNAEQQTPGQVAVLGHERATELARHGVQEGRVVPENYPIILNILAAALRIWQATQQVAVARPGNNTAIPKLPPIFYQQPPNSK